MQSSTIDAVIGYSIATVVGAGGAMGYIKARSVPSLVAGVGSGLIIALGTYKTQKVAHDAYLVTGAAIVLFSLMGKKWLASGKFMPAGLISVLCVGLMARFAPRLFNH